MLGGVAALGRRRQRRLELTARGRWLRRGRFGAGVRGGGRAHLPAACEQAQDALLRQHLGGVAAVLARVRRADVGAQPRLEAAGARDAFLQHLDARRAGW